MTSRDRSDRFTGDAHRIIPLEIADAVAQRLADSIRLKNPEQTVYLKESLAQIGARYLRRRRQEKLTPVTSVQLDRLRNLQAAATDLVHALATLDDETTFRIVLGYAPKIREQLAEGSIWPSPSSQLPIDLQQLAAAAKQAIANASSKRGPRSNASLHQLVKLLCSLYEDLTCRPITHNPYTKTEYTGEPQSEAGRFILGAVKAIDQSVPFTAVNSAIGKLVRRSKRAARSIR